MVELETQRLLLRPWHARDFESYAAYYADEETARYVGGVCTREQAWCRMAALIGHWALRGYGYWLMRGMQGNGCANAFNPIPVDETPIRSRCRFSLFRRIRSAGAMILALLAGAAAMLNPAGAFAQPALTAGDSSLGALQQDIVAHLAGRSVAQRQEGVVSRSTPAERAEAASYLADALAELGLTAQRHDYRLPNVNGLVDLLLAPYRGTNVYTLVEATTPSTEFVIVGAHYDSEPGSPGAGDNAAGVAVVYALASRLSRLETRRLNVLLVFFDQEEDDEVGSRAFVRYLRNEAYDVHSVHVTDLSGWDDDNDRAVVIQSPGPYLERYYREAADRLGIALRLTGGSGSSDNKSFLNAGYRTIGVFGDITRHLHKPTDTYETVDFAFLASMTALMFEVLTDLVGGGPSDAR